MARVRTELTEETAAPRTIRPTEPAEVDVEAAAIVPRARIRRDPASASVPSAAPLSPRREGDGMRDSTRAKGTTKRRRPEAASPSRDGTRFGQISLLGLCAGSMFAAVSLASWSATDPSLSVSAGGPVANLGGPLGAYVADFLYQCIGWASWCVLLVGVWGVLRLAGRLAGSWWNALIGSFGLWMVATGLELLLGGAANRAFPVGGVLGLLTSQFLTANVGQAGGAIFVGLGIVIAATLLFGINWQPIAAGTVERVQTGTPRAARVFTSAVSAAGRGALDLSARAGEAVRARVGGGETDEESDFEEQIPVIDGAEVSVAGLVATGAQRNEPAVTDARGTVRAADPTLSVRNPVRPGAGTSPSDPWDIPKMRDSVWSAAPAPAPRLKLDENLEKPTEVSGRSLVHVEWATDSGIPAAASAADAVGLAGRTPVGYDVPSPRNLDPASAVRSASAPPTITPPNDAVRTPADAESWRDELDDGLPGDVMLDQPTFRAPTASGDPPSNAFGFADVPDEPIAFRPIVPDRPADPVPSRPAKSKRGGATVLPGDLSSGGVNDDGGAVRESDSPFNLPPLALLDEHPAIVGAADESRLQELASKLMSKLRDFQVEGRISAIRPGPVITSFEFEPAPGIKISKIAGLEKDVAMALMATSIRIVAPVPGRGVVGFEIPNDTRQTVWARDVFASAAFRDTSHILPIVLGKDTEGRPFVTDLASAPHLLVGGTTGSGKSVGVNVMLTSLIMTRSPAELRLILIDPKTTELTPYKDIPHLLHPVVTEVSLAAKVLDWTCEEMGRRYKLLADWKARGIGGYNEKVDVESANWTPEKARQYFPDWPAGELIPQPKRLPYIVVVIDELADLMMQVGKDVETSIARIAQKARACGIHLIVATQSPRKEVLTGLIKGNMPTRLAYRVGGGTESRIILDNMGAQGLLGKGDQLFMSPNAPGLVRIHGPFLTDREVEKVTDFCRAQGKPQYAPAIRMEDLDEAMDEVEELPEALAEHYDNVLAFAVQKGTISTSMIQRFTKLGYNRACFIMEHLERNGVVGPADGARPRKVLLRDVGELSG